MRRDHPLAVHACIHPQDLTGVPLVLSRQAMRAEMPRWFGEPLNKLNVAVTYDLMFNTPVMAREGFGCVLGFEGLIYTGPNNGLFFRPPEPALTSPMYVIGKKYQVFSPATVLPDNHIKNFPQAVGSGRYKRKPFLGTKKQLPFDIIKIQASYSSFSPSPR